MQGRDSHRLDPATSIREQKYALYRTLTVLNSGTVFDDYLKRHFLISFSEEMIALFDSMFLLWSFLSIQKV